MKNLKYKQSSHALSGEVKFVFIATLAWFSVLALARFQFLSQSATVSNTFGSFGKCPRDVAFVSNAPDNFIRQKIVAFGSRNSLAYSLLPSAVITKIDPSVKASEDSRVSGLSYAIGRQPLRIESDFFRLSLLNLGLIDSAVVPVSLLSKLNNYKKKSIAIIELCYTECSKNAEQNPYKDYPRIVFTSSALEKYLANFYPEHLPSYKKYCKK